MPFSLQCLGAVGGGGWQALVFERGHCSTGLALFGYVGQMFTRTNDSMKVFQRLTCGSAPAAAARFREGSLHPPSDMKTHITYKNTG